MRCGGGSTEAGGPLRRAACSNLRRRTRRGEGGATRFSRSKRSTVIDGRVRRWGEAGRRHVIRRWRLNGPGDALSQRRGWFAACAATVSSRAVCACVCRAWARRPPRYSNTPAQAQVCAALVSHSCAFPVYCHRFTLVFYLSSFMTAGRPDECGPFYTPQALTKQSVALHRAAPRSEGIGQGGGGHHLNTPFHSTTKQHAQASRRGQPIARQHRRRPQSSHYISHSFVEVLSQ